MPKAWFKFFLAAAFGLGAASPAFAGAAPVVAAAASTEESAGEESVPVQQLGRLDRVPLYRQAECLKTLRPIVEPESLIKAGLTALGAGGPSSLSLTCLDEILPTWESKVADPKLRPSASTSPDTPESDTEEYKEAITNYMEKIKQLACISSNEPGSTAEQKWQKSMDSYCEGKFFPSSEMTTKKEELQKAKLVYEEQYTAKNFDSSFYDIASTFFPKPDTDPVLLSLREKAKCLGVSKILPPHCEGKILSNEERLALAAELIKLEEIKTEKETKREELVDGLRGLLYDQPSAAKILDLPKLKEKYRQIKCLGGVYGELITDSIRSYCEKKGLPTSGGLEARQSEVRELLKNPEVAVGQWKADQAKREAELAEKARLDQRRGGSEYGLRRLLTLYRWHANHYPGAINPLEKFCAFNEAAQLKDLEFAKKSHRIRPLETNLDWEWMAKYGFSERGITALREYTGSFFTDINSGIWRAKPGGRFEPLSEKLQLYRQTLNEMLDRAPRYQGKPVRRFAVLPEEVLEAHQEGKIVTYDGFTSTSKLDTWNWGNETNNRFVIYSANGADISPVSSLPAEGEVLFKSGTRFKILSRKPREGGDKTFDFVMVEVDEEGRPLAAPPPPRAPEAP